MDTATTGVPEALEAVDAGIRVGAPGFARCQAFFELNTTFQVCPDSTAMISLDGDKEGQEEENDSGFHHVYEIFVSMDCSVDRAQIKKLLWLRMNYL